MITFFKNPRYWWVKTTKFILEIMNFSIHKYISRMMIPLLIMTKIIKTIAIGSMIPFKTHKFRISETTAQIWLILIIIKLTWLSLGHIEITPLRKLCFSKRVMKLINLNRIFPNILNKIKELTASNRLIIKIYKNWQLISRIM